jgi:bifunctional UDP-N-acetylglucosamine pyrophosphorylase/glucosamine-1-phosphate N-acetyltransferase
MSLHIIILAAGAGKRMFSKTPKVLHSIAGIPMLARVVYAAQQLNPSAIHVIYGHGGEQVKETLSYLNVSWVKQDVQLGTGHAVIQALPFIPDHAYVLVLSADVPLIQQHTLQALIDCTSVGHNKLVPLVLLIASLENPSGLGRIIRNEFGIIHAIVEEKDANDQQKLINEIYTGICCAKACDLARWLPQLTSSNNQGEYYLTDIIALAILEQHPVMSLTIQDALEIRGVNNRLQLQQLERHWQQRQANQLLLTGVSIADTARIDVRGELTCGQDVFIDINCVFSGNVVLGDGCFIGPNCVLTNVTIGPNCHIYANCVLDGCHIGARCQIGPFARLRYGTNLADDCKIGNFVETKKASFDVGSKACHLSYLGDVTIGQHVNIGAGTITCNYDGVNKHQTIIEDGVFVGSDTQLVAPVTLGAYATIGAGSTIRKHAPGHALTLTESRQKTVVGWQRPLKKQ